MNRYRRIAAPLAVILGLVLGALPGPTGGAASAAGSQELTLALGGMTCAACAFAVKAALNTLDGVHEAKVSYREKQATVSFDPSLVTPEAMIQAIQDAGFEATRIDREGGSNE